MIPQPTQSLMSSSFCYEQTARQVVIGFNSAALVKRASEPKRLKQIQEVLQQFLGTAVDIKFAVGKEPQVAPSAPPPPGDSYTPPPVSFSPPASAPPEPAPPPAVSPPLPEPRSPQTIEEPDELDRAAHGLAEFFNGAVVNFDGETSDEPAPASAPPPVIDEEDDLPF